jgi:hypothetical protein
VDPHARPVPPRVLIQVPPGLTVRSPGVIPHTVYAFDPNGLERIRVRIESADLSLHIDSTSAPADPNETTLSFIWQVPSGIAPGTTITIRATATNFLGLTSADSTRILVQ